jgi:hypothetical protein
MIEGMSDGELEGKIEGGIVGIIDGRELGLTVEELEG